MGSINKNQRNEKYRKPAPIRSAETKFESTVKLELVSKVFFDTKLFSYKEIEELNSRLQDIGIEVLYTDGDRSNESSWCDVPDMSKKSGIEEIYHSIAIGIGIGDLKLGQGVRFQDSEIRGTIQTFMLEGHEGSIHCGAFGFTDVAMENNPRSGVRVPLSKSFFHYYNGPFIEEGTGIRHNLAPSERHPGNRWVETAKWLESPAQRFSLQMVNRAAFLTYRLVRVVEKKPKFFVPVYQVQTHYVNRNMGVVRVESLPPTLKAETLLKIVTELAGQGFGTVHPLVREDIIRINFKDLNIVLQADQPTGSNAANSSNPPVQGKRPPRRGPKLDQETFTIAESVADKADAQTDVAPVNEEVAEEPAASEA